MIPNHIQLKKIAAEIRHWQQANQTSYTIFYRQSGKIMGIYSVNEEDEVGILFVNKDYPNSDLILELIHQHCHTLNEEILVYTWNQEAIDAYEAIVPEFYSLVDLS